MSEKIYVVMGTTGEYSDRSEWPVMAFYDAERAKDYAVLAKDEARIIFNRYPHWCNIPDGVNKYDLKARWDYTGTNYYVMEVAIYGKGCQRDGMNGNSILEAKDED